MTQDLNLIMAMMHALPVGAGFCFGIGYFIGLNHKQTHQLQVKLENERLYAAEQLKELEIEYQLRIAAVEELKKRKLKKIAKGELND